MEDKKIQLAGELGLEKLDNYLNALKKIQEKIFEQLDEGIDYGYPFEGANQKILYFSGARKLAKIVRASVEIRADETIMQGDEVWGRKVLLRLSLPNGDFVEATGICTYDEPASWSRDKRDASKRVKKPFYIVSQIAFKRAYVNGIKMLLGLPDFVDVQLEEVEKGRDIEIAPVEREVEITNGLTATDKQLGFFADLYLKRHLDKNIAHKIIQRLIDRWETGEGITKDTIASVIDYLTKYKRLSEEEYRSSWDNLDDLSIFKTKVELLATFFKKIGKFDILRDLASPQEEDLPI